MAFIKRSVLLLDSVSLFLSDLMQYTLYLVSGVSSNATGTVEVQLSSRTLTKTTQFSSDGTLSYCHDTLLNISVSQVSFLYCCNCVLDPVVVSLLMVLSEPCVQRYFVFVLEWDPLHSHENWSLDNYFIWPSMPSRLFFLLLLYSPSDNSSELWLHQPPCPRSPSKEGNITLNRKPVSLLLLAANGAAML